MVLSLTSCCFWRTSDETFDSVHVVDAALRLRTVYNTKAQKIRDYIASSQDQRAVVQAQVFSRVFLEHIYGKNLRNITSLDTRKLMLHIHPDKQHYTDATGMFQLHQGLLETANLFGKKSLSFPIVWVYHKLFGAFYHLEIQTSCSLERVV